MAQIKLYADIREVNRYFFTIEVDDKLSKEHQEIMAAAKLTSHLLENCPKPNDVNLLSDVQCTDRESARDTEQIIKIEINHGKG